MSTVVNIYNKEGELLAMLPTHTEYIKEYIHFIALGHACNAGTYSHARFDSDEYPFLANQKVSLTVYSDLWIGAEVSAQLLISLERFNQLRDEWEDKKEAESRHIERKIMILELKKVNASMAIHTEVMRRFGRIINYEGYRPSWMR